MIANPQRLTPGEYLALETESSVKHEYRNGVVWAMAGTSDRHNTIALNLALAIRAKLRGSHCSVYFAEVKARLEECNCFYYPDLFVTCDPRDQETTHYKRFPKLIIEVLSDSTEAFDRGDKFRDYRTLPSLEEYVLVSTKTPQVEVFRRTESNLWLLQAYGSGDLLMLESIDLSVPMAEIYVDVNLNSE
ncbi:MAG: Uma2 family endonuclease [Nodosilinea sp. LVE1205-7]|jgi:Uma2 family endonuclease